MLDSLLHVHLILAAFDSQQGDIASTIQAIATKDILTIKMDRNIITSQKMLGYH